MPTACLLYNLNIAKEDKATLQSDLSALAKYFGIRHGAASVLLPSFPRFRGDKYDMPLAAML